MAIREDEEVAGTGRWDSEEEKYVDADAYSPVATGRARPRIGGRGARGRPRSGSAGGKRGASNEYGGGTTNCGGVESCAECVLS